MALNPDSEGDPALPIQRPVLLRRRWRFWTAIGVVGAAAGCLLLWSRAHFPAIADNHNAAQREARPGDSEEADPAEPAVTNPGFVGIEACAACHADRVAEFKATRHFLACCTPEVATMPAGFEPGQGTFLTRDPALQFEMTRNGNDFFQTSIRDTPEGRQTTTAHIDFVYGARGTTDEVYFTWRGNQLYELPMVWLHPRNEWGASPFDENGQGDFGREMTPRCLECHATWFHHVPGTMNEYQREGMLLGVTCERCHGPAREHVAFHQAHPNALSSGSGGAPDRRHENVRVPYAMINPGHLPRARQTDLCAQCHSNAITYKSPALSYRPGEVLGDFVKAVSSRYPEDDRTANQTKYLLESKCYQQSETLTCITCHNPHRSKEAAPLGVAERSCVQCHQPADCAEQDRLPEPVRNNCVGCHMPLGNKIQVQFRTKDDAFVPPARRYEHRIGIYPAAQQEVLLAWYKSQTDDDSRAAAGRLAQALSRHWLDEAEKRRRAYRFLAAIDAYRQAAKIDPAPATLEKLSGLIRINSQIEADWFESARRIAAKNYPQAIEILKKILRVNPEMGKAHGKLGTVYAMSGQPERAEPHLRAAARLDPNDPYGYSMLGWLAFLDGRLKQSLEHYRRAEEVEPYNPAIKYRTGMVLVKLDRIPEAIDCFRRLLEIDPRHVEGCQALAHALRASGETHEALQFARRGVRLSQSKDPGALMTLAECYAAAGRASDAADAAAQAESAARESNPELVPPIHARLEELRASAARTKR